MTININPNANKYGFSLLELSIVLTIGAVLMTGGIILTGKTLDNKSHDDTSEQLSEIMEAINIFVDNYPNATDNAATKYIPCPADPTLGFDDANFGVSDCAYVGILGPTATGNIIAGAVPVSTLNISPRNVRDKFGRAITYVMDKDLGTNAGYAGTGGIIVKNLFGDNLATDGAVLLISHGYNRYGSWSGNGSASRSFTGTSFVSDRENTGQDLAPNTFDHIFKQSVLTTDSNDDIVEYLTKWQLDGVN